MHIYRFLVLSILVMATLAAPTSPNSTKRLRKKQIPWWGGNPCGHNHTGSRSTEKEPLSEESVSGWKIVLKNALEHIDINRSDILKIYKDVISFKDSRHNWLPNITDIEIQPNSNTAQSMIKLYDGLQRFAVTIECMIGEKNCIHKNRRVKITSGRTDAIRFLEGVKEKLRPLLCEVYSINIDLNGSKKLHHPTSAIINPKEWERDIEINLEAQEWGILNRYISYLNFWNNNLNHFNISNISKQENTTKKPGKKGRKHQNNSRKGRPKPKKPRKQNPSKE